MASADEQLAALRERIRAHAGCGFEPCETCTQLVPGEGRAGARIMLVGEAPGASEDRAGRPFVGRAGKLLDVALEQAGLARADVYVTNVVKARPPGNRDPRRAEVEHHLPWLESELALVAPSVVAPLGRHALALFAPGLKVTRVRGVLREEAGRALFPLLHPAAVLRTPALREDFFADVRRLAAALG